MPICVAQGLSIRKLLTAAAFAANSAWVAGRIERYYGRLATVVPPPVDTEVAPPEPTPASAEGETPDESEAALVEEDTANEAVVPADEPRATGAMMRRRGAMTKRPSAMMAPEMAEAPASRGTAWLRVGHPRGAGQERVFVDGRPVGYTPNLFQVGVGSHVVEVKSVASGETVSRRTLNVRADQTRASPAVMPR